MRHISILTGVALFSLSTFALGVTEPAYYAVDLIAPASNGTAMNESGEVIGTSYQDPGCGSNCLASQDTVVWRNGVRTVLPTPAGATVFSVTGINANGWISGNVTSPYSRAVVWKPSGDTYETIDLGVLPNTTISTATGIDDQNRVVGNSTTPFFPPTGAPFMWDETGGMVNLVDLGGSSERPLAISRAGIVATASYWYSLDNPSLVTSMTASPTGFYPPGNNPAGINDSGDQGRFLPSTSGSNLVYLFRYQNSGDWQQLSSFGTGNLTTYGFGGINNDNDVTATVGSTGLIAYGPTGLATSLTSKLSPAYGGGAVTRAGSITAGGKILAQALIGNSARLVRLVPAEPCIASCARVSAIDMVGKHVSRPPGQCTANAYNRVTITVSVTDEMGRAVRNARIAGRIMDGYWTNTAVTAKTGSKGTAKISYTGPACVGSVTFLVEDVNASGLTLDRINGTLAAFVVPQ